jgi:hypothetical protein
MPLSLDDPSAEPQTFALRRLSPFLGVAQFVQYGPARAVSADGRHWQLQVAVRTPRPRWGSLDPTGDQRRMVGYGAWSPIDGLVRLPLDPTVDAAVVHDAAAPLLRILPEAHQWIPFALADRYELWLLDTDAVPLALLASSSDANQLPSPRRPTWHASARGDLSFRASGDGSEPAHHDRDRVEALVNATAGRPVRAQWFRRAPHVEALSAHHPPQGTNHVPGPDELPELPVRSTWRDQEQQQLMDAFIDWQAPLLLTLPTLSDQTRDRLERAACRQPLALDAWHRLYPRVLNKARVKTALVEATLRKSDGEPQNRP